jgi:glutathione S-transferase
MSLTLIIGNKNYSSWSLRPWLLMKHAGLDFRELIVPLYQSGSTAELLKYAPTAKVPVLHDGDLHVWDSLAICEHIAEKTGFGWPKAPAARALARSVSAEMHSGFTGLRNQCPFNVRARKRVAPTPELAGDVSRVQAIWRDCRERSSAAGPWLFGTFSIADATYAPVALRFNSYSIDLASDAAAYLATITADRYVVDWMRAAECEAWKIESTEVVGVPA